VLQVINSSPGDLAPVFAAILDKAHSLCGIALGELELYEDGQFRAVAMRGVSGSLAELLRRPFIPPPNSPPARLLAGEPIVQIADLFELAQQQPDDPRLALVAASGPLSLAPGFGAWHPPPLIPPTARSLHGGPIKVHSRPYALIMLPADLSKVQEVFSDVAGYRRRD
jgi:hypothetical protein